MLQFHSYELLQMPEFGLCELSPSPARHALRRQPGKRNPVETFHLITERFHNSSHLSVASFKKRQDDLRAPCPGDRDDLTRFRKTIFKRNTSFQVLEVFIQDPPLQPHPVHALNPVFWMHHRICEITVIRQEKNAGRIAVESTYRKNPLLDPDVIHHRRPIALIVQRGDTVFRLVEENVVGLSLEGDEIPLDRYAIVTRIDFGAKLANNSSIDLDDAGKYQFIILATRANSCERKVPVQPNNFLMNP